MPASQHPAQGPTKASRDEHPRPVNVVGRGRCAVMSSSRRHARIAGWMRWSVSSPRASARSMFGKYKCSLLETHVLAVGSGRSRVMKMSIRSRQVISEIASQLNLPRLYLYQDRDSTITEHHSTNLLAMSRIRFVSRLQSNIMARLTCLDQDLNPHNFHETLRRQSHSHSISIPQDLSDIGNMQPMDPGAMLLQEALGPPSMISPLPAFIKPLPTRYTSDDIAYLAKKGALTVPSPPLRNALLRCFVEFIHPYMPLLDIDELVHSIDSNDGKNPISLLLFQSIMFVSIASVDIKYIKAAGYETRREARRDFFQKTRVSPRSISNEAPS